MQGPLIDQMHRVSEKHKLWMTRIFGHSKEEVMQPSLRWERFTSPVVGTLGLGCPLDIRVERVTDWSESGVGGRNAGREKCILTPLHIQVLKVTQMPVLPLSSNVLSVLQL